MRQAHTENTRRKTSRGVESSENAYPRLPVNGHPGGVALGVASVHLGVARTLEVGTPRLVGVVPASRGLRQQQSSLSTAP